MTQTFLKNRMAALVATFLMGIATALAQTNTVKHIVERGETLESIAQHYGVTKDDITRLNPDAAQFVYVGMELQVPQTGNSSVQSEETPASQSFVQSQSEEVSNTFSKKDDDGNDEKWGFVVEGGYGFLPKSSGAKGTNWSLELTVGAKYKILAGLYASARIGYNSANTNVLDYDNEYGYLNAETTTHFVEVPLEIGYSFQTKNESFAIMPFGGFDFNVSVAGKAEQGIGKNKKETDLNNAGKVGVGSRLGIRLRLWEFNISGAYHIAINKKQKGFNVKRAYPEISIGFGF